MVSLHMTLIDQATCSINIIIPVCSKGWGGGRCKTFLNNLAKSK